MLEPHWLLLAPHCVYVKAILGLCWDPIGAVLEPNGATMGLCWDHTGDVLGLDWRCAGATMLCWDHTPWAVLEGPIQRQQRQQSRQARGKLAAACSKKARCCFNL